MIIEREMTVSYIYPKKKMGQDIYGKNHQITVSTQSFYLDCKDLWNKR